VGNRRRKAVEGMGKELSVGKVRDVGGKEVGGVPEVRPEYDVREEGREVVHGPVKVVTELQVRQITWQVVHGFVEKVAQFEAGEGWGEVIDKVVP
jgi:hypothetical protein